MKLINKNARNLLSTLRELKENFLGYQDGVNAYEAILKLKFGDFELASDLNGVMMRVYTLTLMHGHKI